jgi:hypothetical protein
MMMDGKLFAVCHLLHVVLLLWSLFHGVMAWSMLVGALG